MQIVNWFQEHKFWNDPLRFFKIFKAKGDHLAKKWVFGQTDNILIYQSFKRKIFALMTYGQFTPRNSSNLKFVVQDSSVQSLWIFDDKFQIWAISRQKLTIGHKRKFFLLKILYIRIFSVHFLAKWPNLT